MLSWVNYLKCRIINPLISVGRYIIVSSEKNIILYKLNKLESSIPPLRLSILKNVKFSHLKCLLLVDNNICSIENLPEIEMPELEYLDLSGNLITKLKSLRRCNYPKLDYLIISINKFTKSVCVWVHRWIDWVK